MEGAKTQTKTGLLLNGNTTEVKINPKTQTEGKQTRRLLLFPAPFPGHVNPMLHLAAILHSKGFAITIFNTQYNPINPDHYPHFTFHIMYDSMLEKYSKSKVDTFVVISAMNHCSEPFRDCLAKILSEANEADHEHVAALILDPLWGFAGSVAASFNLPVITLRTGNMSALAVYFSLHLLQEKGYFTSKDDKLDEPIPEFPPLKVKDLPSVSDHHVIEDLVEGTKISQGIICNTFEELEASAIAKIQQAVPFPIFPIGPLHKHQSTSIISIQEEDQTTIAWLNTQMHKSVLYMSFGTVADMTKEEFIELAWGLLESDIPFLWVVRPGLIQGSDTNDLLPEGYLEMVGQRGHISKWAPQLEVLAHPAVGGFWTHNGWNSTLESICEGVPMLCQPLFADQRMNARNVSENWKIGLKMEKGVKREDIARAIRKLMLEEEGTEMRRRVTTLKEKADLCLKEGGSSYSSLERLTSYLLSI